MFRVNLLLRLLACAFLLFIPLQGLDQWFYDLFFRMRVTSPVPTEVVLVRVDDSRLFDNLLNLDSRFSPEKLPFDPGSYSIWYDSFYHRLLEKIQESEPRLVVFSTYFDWVHLESSRSPWMDHVVFSAALNAENKLIPPPRALTNEFNYGFNNLFPDGDNVVRKTHLVYSSGMSLTLKVFQTLAQQSVSRNLIDALWIDFRGPAGIYPQYDGVGIVENRIATSGLKGKIVLVGREEGSATDVATPVGKMPRMEVLANTLETFLQNREIRILPKAFNYFVSVVCIVFSVWVILTLPLNISWLLQVVFGGVLLLAGLVAFSEFKVWFGVANPMMCILGTHLLVIGFRLSEQEEEQWRLTQEAQYLKDMDQFKNNFISLFSHDLKTPIAKIKAITERLLGEHPDLPVPVKDSLKTLDRTNGELSRFISDILKVTKMESMAFEPVKEVVDLNRLVEEAIGRLKFHADVKKIEIVADLEPLFSMEGDKTLLLEVMFNLIENGIKYSPDEKKIVIRTREELGVVRVSVIDEGPGIDPTELPRVTGKFYRGKKAAENTKGSGLGLYLSKYFVELHQGFLSIDSSLGKGTTVSFTLPLPA
ncbi:MAG: CHASE2 domain-containing protein [Deltaproteobacteria bacterium]|nr:CHASE2 domain-containing protein [Deltaproteobacteria bacterium]